MRPVISAAHRERVEGYISAAVAALHEAGASAIVHCGFGLGVAEINAALRALDWDPAAFEGDFRSALGFLQARQHWAATLAAAVFAITIPRLRHRRNY